MMLKPNDSWNWYFDDPNKALMLDLGDDMLFKVNLSAKLLANTVYTDCDFTVEDATAFQTFKEIVCNFELSTPRQAELVLNCIAAKRFHKPVQPKSWFFDPKGEGYTPEEGDIVRLTNSHNQGYFMVIEVCENASLCAFIEMGEFKLDVTKSLNLGEPIKVMHNRMECANHRFAQQPIALVS